MAVIVTCVLLVTLDVVIEKDWEFVPCGMVIELGTAALLGLLLVIFTTSPPVGERLVNLTVAIDVLPPTRVDGLDVNDDSAA